jgi:hypothetical protein
MATKTNRLWAIAALVVIGTGFTACLKSVDTTPSRPIAAFSVINGIVSSISSDFYDNGTKVPNVVMPMGFAGRNYQAYGGVHKFDFMKTGTTTPFATSTTLYDSLQYYTLVSYGDSSAAYVKPILDVFSGISSTTVNFRFFNLSPNSTAVDLYVSDKKVDSNLTYVGNSSVSTAFKSMAGITSASSIKVKLAGSATTLATLTTATLQSGYIYTIYLAGMKDSLAGPLKPQVGYVQSLY